MLRKTIGVALIVLGDVLLIVCLTADPLGLGEGKAIGYKQIIGTIGSIIVQMVGIVLSQMESKPKAIIS